MRTLLFAGAVLAVAWVGNPEVADGEGGLGDGRAPNYDELLSRVEPAVVHVETDDVQGSGFFVARNLVVTNFHVMEGANRAVARSRERSYPVKGFVAAEPSKDLIILVVERAEDGPTLPLAAELPKRLDEVLVLGSPRGLAGTVTRGDVSAIRSFREIRIAVPDTRALGYDDETRFIQTTAPISKGNSGGPLVNLSGEVVGVNTWGEPKAQNLNFAIACEHVRELLAETKVEDVRSLVSLPRTRSPARPVPRSPRRVPALPFRVELPDGRIVTRELLSVPTETLKVFYKDPRNVRLEREIEDGGTLTSGILYGVGDRLFGIPEGFVVLTLPRDVTEPIIRAVLTPYGTLYEISARQVRVQDLAAIVGFKRGQIDGHVHLFERFPVYYGQWTEDRPSKHGLFYIETASGLSAIVQRGESDQVSALYLIEGGEVARTFRTHQEAVSDIDAKALIEALEEREADLKKGAEIIVKAVQAEAKLVQSQIIAVRGSVTRQAIAARINARRDGQDPLRIITPWGTR